MPTPLINHLLDNDTPSSDGIIPSRHALNLTICLLSPFVRLPKVIVHHHGKGYADQRDTKCHPNASSIMRTFTRLERNTRNDAPKSPANETRS